MKRLPISLNDWKTQVKKSMHIKNGEKVVFQEIASKIYATIEYTSITLGVYFIDDKHDSTLKGTGWYHE